MQYSALQWLMEAMRKYAPWIVAWTLCLFFILILGISFIIVSLSGVSYRALEPFIDSHEWSVMLRGDDILQDFHTFLHTLYVDDEARRQVAESLFRNRMKGILFVDILPHSPIVLSGSTIMEPTIPYFMIIGPFKEGKTLDWVLAFQSPLTSSQLLPTVRPFFDDFVSAHYSIYVRRRSVSPQREVADVVSERVIPVIKTGSIIIPGSYEGGIRSDAGGIPSVSNEYKFVALTLNESQEERIATTDGDTLIFGNSMPLLRKVLFSGSIDGLWSSIPFGMRLRTDAWKYLRANLPEYSLPFPSFPVVPLW